MAADAVAGVAADADPAPRSPAGRLVKRWVPASMTGRSRSVRRRRLAASVALLGVVTAILTTAITFGGRPARESPPPLPPAGRVAVTSAEADRPPVSKLVISVVGKVLTPGLVTIPAGSRVADALAAAGGAVPGADLLGLNMARRVTDGEQLAVGVPVPVGQSAQFDSGAPAVRLDLNAASPEQLDTLPGIGQVMAKRIVEWRTRHGRFSTVEQLRDVDGIGESKFAKLREQVIVE